MNVKLNLKYSDNLDRDYKKLSKGRKNYVKKMAGKQKLTISNYLNSKYDTPCFEDMDTDILDVEFVEEKEKI